MDNIRKICKSLEKKKVYVEVLNEYETFYEGEERYFSYLGNLKILDNSVMIQDVFGDIQLSYDEISLIESIRV